MLPNKLALVAISAVILAGCTTSSRVNAGKSDIARAARGIVGLSLIGAKGASPADQDGIDGAVIGMCAVKAYTETECRRHQLLTGAAS